MTTNQEGRQAAIRDSTSTAYGVAADWHALFDDAGISAGTFNERLLAWINAELSASYSNLVSAMQAYAEDAGYDGWEDMATLVLAMNGAETLLNGETQGLAFDFTDQSALIIDTGTPANNYDSTGIVAGGSLVGPSGKLTYTSPSNKLTMQSDGVMRYQAHNLYLNSAAPANQSITVVSGASYAVTITGTVSVTASGAATGTWTAGTNTFTAATTTLTLGSTSGSGTVHVRRTPSNDDYIATAGAAKYALPIEYDTSGNCLGMLVEEARTNLLLYSETFSASEWVTAGNNSTVTANQAVAPNGLTKMALLSDDSGGGTGVVRINTGFLTVTSGSNTISVYAKPGGCNYLTIQTSSFDAAGNGVTIFNLTTGAVSVNDANHSNETATLMSDGVTWRFQITFSTTTDLTGLVFLGMSEGGMSTIDVPRDGTSTIYIWGAQLEAGSFPTSPIITYGATATRAADNISIVSTAFPWSGATDSVFAHFTGASGANTSSGQFVFVMDGTQDIDLLSPNSASQLNARASIGGSCVLATSYTGAGLTGKVAIANAASDMAACYDGGTVVLDTTNGVPGGSGTFYIGSRNSTAPYNGIIKAISYVPRRKSDSELQTETT